MSKKNTKKEIRDIARILFNKKGYNSVSMRDISNELGISVGNLTYHYNKKEDLIEAIVLEMHKRYKIPNPPKDLEGLDSFFNQIQENFKENAFYFWHYTQLSEISESIKDIQIYMLREDKSLLKEGFNNLRNNNLLKEEEFIDQYNYIIDNLMLISIYWIPHSKLEKSETTSHDFHKHIWSIIYPILTNKGKNVYLKSIKNKTRD